MHEYCTKGTDGAEIKWDEVAGWEELEGWGGERIDDG